MDDLTMTTATVPKGSAKNTEAESAFDLEAQTDESLRELIAEAGAILEGRANLRRREAIAEIKRLAKENGLAVDVKTPARKRGRPRSSEPKSD